MFTRILCAHLVLALSCAPHASPPRAVGTASLVTGTFTTFLVEADCAADDSPASCDPATGYPLDLGVRTALVGTFVPSAAMCGPFRLSVHLDEAVAWEGTVSGGGESNAVGTFIIGEAEPGLHVLTLEAEATDPCFDGELDAWFGQFTLAATEPPRIGALAGAGALTQEQQLGRDLFVVCEPCHGPAAAGRQALNAPGIASQEQWYLERQIENFKAGRRGTHDQDLYGMQMRAMALELSDAERVRAVASYVASLPHPTPATTIQGDVARGAELFLVCAVCHGDDAGGNAEVGAPRLTVQQDWYLMRQIGNFRAGLRGYHADDKYGREMRPMTGTLPDEQAVRDVVAFIQTLRGTRRSASDVVTTAATAPPTQVAVAAPAPAPAPASAP
ncbi:MAG: c-type cytochrome, partial [Myxococcota bacterium]